MWSLQDLLKSTFVLSSQDLKQHNHKSKQTIVLNPACSAKVLLLKMSILFCWPTSSPVLHDDVSSNTWPPPRDEVHWVVKPLSDPRLPHARRGLLLMELQIVAAERLYLKIGQTCLNIYRRKPSESGQVTEWQSECCLWRKPHNSSIKIHQGQIIPGYFSGLLELESNVDALTQCSSGAIG